MNKQFNSWKTVGIVSGILVFFLVIGIFSYISDIKDQLAKLREESSQRLTQISQKDSEIATKNDTIADLQNQKTDLEGKNTGLTTDLETKEKELTRRLGEVKKLQGSVKTVGRCLVGTIGLIEALKQENRDMALKSAMVMEATCKESGEIIKQVEGFSTDTSTARY